MPVDFRYRPAGMQHSTKREQYQLRSLQSLGPAQFWRQSLGPRGDVYHRHTVWGRERRGNREDESDKRRIEGSKAALRYEDRSLPLWHTLAPE